MHKYIKPHVVTLDMERPIWEHFFQVFPLVVVGSKEADGGFDLAPKHMAMPLSWENYFGFVCSSTHGTYQNIAREGRFTVSYPRPSQVVLAALAASPRDAEKKKPTVSMLPTFASADGEGVFLEDGYLFFECEHDRTVDGFGPNSLIVGRIVAAHVHEDALRSADGVEEEQLAQNPLLAYLYPGRFAEVGETKAFPFPTGFSR